MKKIILITTICAFLLVSLCSCSLFLADKIEEPEKETQNAPISDNVENDEQTDMDQLGDKESSGETAAESETASETEHNIIIGDPEESEDETDDPADYETNHENDSELEGDVIG